MTDDLTARLEHWAALVPSPLARNCMDEAAAEITRLKAVIAAFSHPAVTSSLDFLAARYEKARCDNEAVACCVRCKTMFLVNTVRRAALSEATPTEGEGA